jgi:DNA repair protein RadC
MSYPCVIRDLPDRGRPREALEREGTGRLSDLELVSLVLGSGGPGRPLAELAKDALAAMEPGEGEGLERLLAVKGLGKAKASALCAAVELGRRRIREPRPLIKGPEDVFKCVAYLGDRPQEHFVVVTLNGAHELVSVRTVSVGTINRTIVHPREIYAKAVSDRACSIVVAHNHPSGRLEPSREDVDVTNRLIQAGEILGISLLDHIVFSREEFLSLKERGFI